ncbi:MAG: hypothetical protein DCC74_09335 [Proteobacteria bacterium]|nr:MAG: hypothetical protein DCC74_09335 [Pseudomonadota bacterium]
MSASALHSFLSLALGFALAGMLVSGYQALADRPAGFNLLEERRMARALAAVPFLVFAAPFIIMRNIVRDDGHGPRRVQFVMLSTVIVGFWSMMSGTAVIAVLEAAGLIT